MSFFRAVCMSITILAGLSATASGKNGDGMIVVEAAKSKGTVNQLAFGHNMEAGDGRGIFSEPFNAVKFNTDGIKYGQGFWNIKTRSAYPAPKMMMNKLNTGMMRYPGGCLAHNFNWKKAVGPLQERGDWQFGLDEFIKFCRELNVEPMITVTDYALPADQIPQHAAELVEYLNAPAIPKYPWAMKRKIWGNPEPYKVKWFELGNETNHGNHQCQPRRRYSPQEYVKYANATAAAMKEIDPSIKLGIITVPGSAEDYDCEWNKVVFKGAGPSADFVVIHVYAPFSKSQDTTSSFKASMAYVDQLEYRVGKYHELIKASCGKDLPLAVTEFNINCVEDTSRSTTYSAGLMCADMMRIWLKPENRIATANFWHVMNGVWGMFKASNGVITQRMATLPFFELWGKHFGHQLVDVQVKNVPGCEVAASRGLDLSRGDKFTPSRKIQERNRVACDLELLNKAGVPARMGDDGVLRITLNGRDKDFYGDFARFIRPDSKLVPPNTAYSYKISFSARYIPAPGCTAKGELGIGMCDTRGWGATRSAVSISGIHNYRNWNKFEKSWSVLPDSPGATMLLRLEHVVGKVFGTLEIKDLRVDEQTAMVFPAYPAITASASLSKDGKILYLIVFNRSNDHKLAPVIKLKHFNAASGKFFELFQPNISTRDYFDARTGDVKIESLQVKHSFPPHSMTAFEFYSK